jgi:hypothetical protein
MGILGIHIQGGHQYICEQDGTVLLTEYANGIQEIGSSCQHYEWVELGNGCYPFPLDEEACGNVDDIIQNAIMHAHSSLSTYFLLPSHQ